MHSCILPPQQNRTPKGFCNARSSGTIHTVSQSLGQGGRSNVQVLGVNLAMGSSPHLLAILVLQVQPRLDVASGLLKGLALRHFSRVVCADADGIGAEEEHHVSTELWEGGRGG